MVALNNYSSLGNLKEGWEWSFILALWVLRKVIQMSPWPLFSWTHPLFSSSFVILSIGWLLLSFSPQGGGGSEISPGGRWGAGSRVHLCLPLIMTSFLANPPSSVWLGGAPAALVPGADGNTAVAKSWWWRREKWQPCSWLSLQDTEKELILSLTISLIVVATWFPGNKFTLFSRAIIYLLSIPPPSRKGVRPQPESDQVAACTVHPGSGYEMIARRRKAMYIFDGHRGQQLYAISEPVV